ncbi:ThuA domain-containing protein [Tuwongella immobilis]|uniref:Uncharacterized protein n=1 Tax=Tuwongella immobilis TaxID=692036 RepID=A0A6C2YQC9_9BACT|nr:ThuA domain-containing protein [Tuwongella immobilis]VIP03840.1 Signal peptide and transmembrane prediction OS=Pirellula staleyi (strain ATCC 27377 / DSM 6068 / ICPB 4128) GN=Psta_2567 PE=4 SV=1: ThuA [Tuwongella immobilis]VTS05047.1 Signal peptide and transmembrane prediction OS=Pirellula staleyi (strain ATCC 27377 / DSM 6068 / ICPB 4128) GN=Psta_2567 PE=4 SV=1: ThuA [Tuwongella immobilis]
MPNIRRFFLGSVMTLLVGAVTGMTVHAADDHTLVYPGGDGPGKGKHIVLISGDEEYRSEEVLPQLARILSVHHGFRCTVLFAIDPKSGNIEPTNVRNIPGLEVLPSADLVVMFLRFRDLPDDQMKWIVDYLEAGKPVVAIRTSTHAFNLNPKSKYANYTWTSKVAGWEGGFGKRLLGETWFTHHGNHGSQSTRGLIAPGAENNPILRGIKSGDIWGPTDVYGVRLPKDVTPLVLGQVLKGMKPTDEPVDGKQNNPMMPIAWTKPYDTGSGKVGKAFVSTIGAANDLPSEGVRRLLVNGCYWAIGMADQIPAQSKVDIVGPFEPSPFKFGGFKKGVKPADLQLK